jgi:CheY-like chemotaxis protein
MKGVRILIVDDEENWLNSLPEILLKRLDPDLKVDVAENFSEALRKVKNKNYDLVSVDLELLGEINPSMNPDLEGMDLLKECRSSTRNQSCGLLVLSGRATPSAVYKALERYGVNAFLDKQDFGDGASYIVAVQTAIRRARLQQAKQQTHNRYQLTFTYDRTGLIRGDLVGPNHRSEVQINNTAYVDLDDLARRADDLNLRLSAGDHGAWRYEARSIGTAIYQTIVSHRPFLSLLSTARALAANRTVNNLSLQFSGPPSCLSVPYELMRDEDDYFALAHIMTRRLSEGGPRFTTKSESFFRFIEKLVEKEEPLRVLIVGANTDGHIPAVEEEALLLADLISSDLNILGISHEITTLLGDDVHYARLSEALQDGQHIFHFAGHGNFDESLPERSPIILKDREITAADLQLLTQRTELQFVFLSCCLAARTGRQVGRSDFHGFLHALSQADIPATLAYRWEVKDKSAFDLATDFYDFLWRNLCPGQALLNSRRNIAMGEEGRDDETWAAPVLLSQAT